MTFEYLQKVVVEGTLEVENIGQCVLQANNDLAHEYYLIVQTELGWTEVVEYGPCVPDLPMLQETYQIKYNRFEYSQSKLERIIDKFLNDPKKLITQAKITSIEEIRNFLINPIDKMFSYERRISDE